MKGIRWIAYGDIKGSVGVKIKTLQFMTFILVFFASTFITAQAAPKAPARHVIKFDKNQAYGKNTKWEDILLQEGYSICVDRQDRVYLTDGTHNRVLFFDADGNLVRSVGQKGQGPGDFDGPRIISCFNNSLIAVCENLMIHTVSIHRTDGTFIQKFHPQYAPYYAWLTGVNHLVYLTSGLVIRDKNNMKKLSKLFSENNNSCHLISSYERQNSEYFYDEASNMPWPTGFKYNLFGEMRVSGNERGEILVGMTDEIDFELYEPGMKNKRTVRLELPKLDQVRPYVEKMKQQILKEKGEYFFKEKYLANKFGKLEFSPNHLPYYRRFLLDDHGRIFMFLNDYSVRGKKQQVNVYTTKGELLQMIELDLTDFELYLDSNIFLYVEPVAVSERYIYFLLPATNKDGDLQSRVYRSALKINQ